MRWLIRCSRNQMPKTIQSKALIDVKKVSISEPALLIDEFTRFCQDDISAAAKELKRLKTEQRKHLQKLVYSNLVDRFDSLVDKLILWFSINRDDMRETILKKLETDTISKKEAYELFFLKDKSYDSVVSKIQDQVRVHFLRERHSSKLKRILQSLGINDINNPRVHENGVIYESRTYNKQHPNSILGYADWLYSRRNGMVHGNGKQLTRGDLEQIKSQFKIDMSQVIRLKLSSITAAVTYYRQLSELILNALRNNGK